MLNTTTLYPVLVSRMPEKKQLVTSLRVDPDLWKETKVQAIRRDLTLTAAVQEALEQWIDKKLEKEEK